MTAKLDEASLVSLNTQVIVRVGWDLSEASLVNPPHEPDKEVELYCVDISGNSHH